MYRNLLFYLYINFCCFLRGHLTPRGTLPAFGAIIFILSFLILLVAIVYLLKRYAFKVRIDQNEKTIFFKNIITQQTHLYDFSDFDCYLDTLASNLTGTRPYYKVIYLIKNKKAEKIITGFYYSNMEELQQSLYQIKYLGFQKNFSVLARKALLNKPIVDWKLELYKQIHHRQIVSIWNQNINPLSNPYIVTLIFIRKRLCLFPGICLIIFALNNTINCPTKIILLSETICGGGF